jgi:hypothetical protein
VPDDDELFAPSVFMADYDLPEPSTVANEPMPRATEGGMVEMVKRAVVTAVREAVTNVGMTINDQPIHIDLEYPTKEVHYPGIWVQFSPTSVKRAGIGHEAMVKDGDGNWCPIQEWEFQGRVTLSIVALKNKDRDRISDMVRGVLAFARPIDLVLTKPTEDTKQHRALLATITENPYIAMTPNTDVIYQSGQGVDVGVPWQDDARDNTLVYTDGHAFDVLGQFNVKFRHDGLYELARIDMVPHMVDKIEDPHVISPWHGVVWRTT